MSAIIAGGDPETPLSRISKTLGADSGIAARACKIPQKSGEVMISFLSGLGCSMQSLRPWRTSCDVFFRVSAGKLDTL